MKAKSLNKRGKKLKKGGKKLNKEGKKLKKGAKREKIEALYEHFKIKDYQGKICQGILYTYKNGNLHDDSNTSKLKLMGRWRN